MMSSTYKYSNLRRLLVGCMVMAGVAFTGCSKQLDIKPESFISPEELYKDEAGIKSGLVGIYRQLLELKRSDYVIVGMVGTDEGKTTNFVPTWGT
ncbi:MAG TPA: hypothetical protein VGD35_17885, partial [Chitinophaga sp.]